MTQRIILDLFFFHFLHLVSPRKSSNRGDTLEAKKIHQHNRSFQLSLRFPFGGFDLLTRTYPLRKVGPGFARCRWVHLRLQPIVSHNCADYPTIT